jgi:hypothetical protein
MVEVEDRCEVLELRTNLAIAKPTLMQSSTPRALADMGALGLGQQI